MKKAIIAIAVLLCSGAAYAQNSTGTVSYKETIKLDLALEGDMAQFADLIPKEQSFNKVLYFSPDASMYVNDKKVKETVASDNSIAAMIAASIPEEKYYNDLKGHTAVTQRDFMSRKFLVTSSAPQKKSWKMTGKQKKILDYPCQEAMMTLDSEEVHAWFTPAIAVGTGPNTFIGLPGLILEVSVGKMYHIQATSVKAGAVDTKMLVKPTEGKKMTNEQFEAMVKEKTKEMQSEYGGGNGNVMFRVNTK